MWTRLNANMSCWEATVHQGQKKASTQEGMSFMQSQRGEEKVSPGAIMRGWGCWGWTYIGYGTGCPYWPWGCWTPYPGWAYCWP